MKRILEIKGTIEVDCDENQSVLDIISNIKDEFDIEMMEFIDDSSGFDFKITSVNLDITDIQ